MTAAAPTTAPTTRSADRCRPTAPDYYTKGEYKFEDKPVMTAMSTASEASESQLQTRVQLAGAVEVNFKSDYLPLDKMATPGMIAAIQGNSTPVDPNVIPSAKNAAGGAASGRSRRPAAPAGGLRRPWPTPALSRSHRHRTAPSALDNPAGAGGRAAAGPRAVDRHPGLRRADARRAARPCRQHGQGAGLYLRPQRRRHRGRTAAPARPGAAGAGPGRGRPPSSARTLSVGSSPGQVGFQGRRGDARASSSSATWCRRSIFRSSSAA